jgi:hypothetical protein
LLFDWSLAAYGFAPGEICLRIVEWRSDVYLFLLTVVLVGEKKLGVMKGEGD